MARLNEYGEVELESDPLANLPKHLVASLEGFVLVERDPLVSLRKIDGLQFLMSEWQGVDFEEIPNWLSNNAGNEYRIRQDEEGNWIKAQEGEDQRRSLSTEMSVIPAKLYEQLKRDVLHYGEIEFIARLESLELLLGEWSEMLVDDEKLIGHLLRSHMGDASLASRDSEALVNLHAEAHSSAAGV